MDDTGCATVGDSVHRALSALAVEYQQGLYKAYIRSSTGEQVLCVCSTSRVYALGVLGGELKEYIDYWGLHHARGPNKMCIYLYHLTTRRRLYFGWPMLYPPLTLHLVPPASPRLPPAH
jgi:hypothetical protein